MGRQAIQTHHERDIHNHDGDPHVLVLVALEGLEFVSTQRSIEQCQYRRTYRTNHLI